MAVGEGQRFLEKQEAGKTEPLGAGQQAFLEGRERRIRKVAIEEGFKQRNPKRKYHIRGAELLEILG